MVDKIKRAAEELEAPTCPHCQIAMIWVESRLIARGAIRHLFFCSSCGRVGESSSEVKSITIVPPDRLSAPALKWLRRVGR